MITRRKILAGAAATLAMPAIIGRAAAQGEKLDLGVITSLSGVFANVGEQVEIGNRLAYEYYKEAAGRPLGYVLLDDHGDPGRSVRLVQEAMQKQGIKHFIGTTNSAIALAVAKEVYRGGGVNINLAGADEMTGVDCNKASFRWPVATYSAANATIRPFVKRYPDAKRWYTITGQYVFGESLLRNTVATLTELGCEHIGNSYHSLSDREYSGFITSAIAAEPDVLAICNFGSQTIDVLRQAVSFGMKRNTKILVVWSTALDQFQAWGPDICEGVYFGANYWHGVDTPGNRLFREKFEAAHKRVPNYLSAAGWAVTQIIVEGLNKAGTADVPAVIAALEGLSYEGLTGTETIRPEDHQVLKPYYFMRGKAKAEMADPDDYIEILGEEKVFLAPDKTGCKMSA
ncbi:ABC transporter substrate-binding protein [Rhodoligotrophos defluvii]|uniref:ABC transporter substrate-binding protein n=1 Tax=Rhodoligotrophos defluvii TaxID=2561934 RepID=UPI0014851CD3|nr:ABC transporter substrate-binding protein [Rhodoligotrophos defluvii]